MPTLRLAAVAVRDEIGLHERSLHIRAIREPLREADFVCSTDAIDSYGEIVEQDWDLSRYLKNPVVLFAHQSRELPIGQAKNVKVENGELVATLMFASEKANPLAENVWQSVREGVLRAVSVGFDPHEVRTEKRDGVDVTVLAKNELYEISVTPIGANPEALAKQRAKAIETARAKAAPKATPNPPATTGASTGASMNTKSSKEIAAAAMKLVADECTKAIGICATGSDDEVKGACEAVVARCEECIAECKEALGLAMEPGEKSALTAALRTLRATEATSKALESQNAALVAQRDAATAKAAELESSLVETEVSALVGVKITPAEKQDFVELAKSNRPLFERMVAQRAPLELLGGPIVQPEKAPPPAASAPAGDGLAAIVGKRLAASSDAAASGDDLSAAVARCVAQ